MESEKKRLHILAMNTIYVSLEIVKSNNGNEPRVSSGAGMGNLSSMGAKSTLTQ